MPYFASRYAAMTFGDGPARWWRENNIIPANDPGITDAERYVNWFHASRSPNAFIPFNVKFLTEFIERFSPPRDEPDSLVSSTNEPVFTFTRTALPGSPPRHQYCRNKTPVDELVRVHDWKPVSRRSCPW
jgi:hypothetical protein